MSLDRNRLGWCFWNPLSCDVYYCFAYFPVRCHTLNLILLRLLQYLCKLMIVQFELNHINNLCCHCCCLEISFAGVFNFLYHVFGFIALVGETVSIKKSIELFKDGNWWSIALQSVKLSVQWLTLPNSLNASWQSNFSCNVFSVSEVF